MSSKGQVIILGGAGKIALLAAKKLTSRGYSVTSVVRSEHQFATVEAAGAHPVHASLETTGEGQYALLFKSAKVVIWAAGAGGGDPARTNAVDHEAAVKVMNAIEQMPGAKPRFITISAIDTRDLSKDPPNHYTEDDIQASKKAHESIGAYYDAKLKADQSLVERTAFKWTILRPGHLSDDAATGKVQIGLTPISPSISREDVAEVVAQLVEHEDAAGLALDLVGGEGDIESELQAAISQRKTTEY